MRKKAVLLSFLVLFFIAPFIGTAQPPPLNVQDSLALVDLYNSTNGPGWLRNTNWLTSAPASTWAGVGLSVGRVGILYLDRNRLIGTIPESIGNLTGMLSLYLNNNGLTGPIPASLSNLPSLTTLDLSFNQLTGSIPAGFDNFKSVNGSSSSFRFQQNQLSGIIPAFSHFVPGSGTASFTFGDNQFTFSSFEAAFMVAHPGLLMDTSQASLPLIVNGNVLSVAAGGDVTANTYYWYKDGSLVRTVTGDSTFTATTPGNYSVAVTSTLVPRLTLYSTSLATNVQDSLALVDLYNSTGGSQWTNRTNWLSSAPLSTWYGVKAPGGRVTGLVIATNNLTGTLPASIGNLSALVELDLDHNNISGTLPSSLGSLSSLESLNLSYNQITGAIPTELGNMSRCEEIELRYNNLTGSIPASLGNLPRLFDLYLFHNQLTGNLPVFNNTGLNHLDLSYNQLTGPLPEFHSDFVANISLSHNQLTGTIPAVYFTLTYLSTFNVAYNQLTGEIPPIVNSKGLSALMLSHNQLTGTIPLSMNKISYLSDLELDSNRLTGPIPAEAFTHFSQYGEYKLQGNRFTFSGMEYLPHSLVTDLSSRYAPQYNIPLHQNGNLLSVSAGGNLAQDTFRLYKDGVLSSTQIGDSVFTITEVGRYNIVVTNPVAPLLKLYSDSLGASLLLPTSTTSAQQAITGSSPADVTDGIFKVATITPAANANGLSGNVTALVTIDPAVAAFNGHPYVQRHYDITPDANSENAQATITLYFTQQDFDGYNAYVTTHSLGLPLLPSNGVNNGNLLITQYHGTFTGSASPANYSQGVELITPLVTWDAADGWWVVSFPVSGFSGFYLSTGLAPLPLSLLQFTGVQQGGTVVLKWQTTNEVNTKQFVVQRSGDGVGFGPIGVLPAVSKPGDNGYGFVDNNPLGGDNFYRLQLMDIDGLFAYSPVVKVKGGMLGSGCFVYPNPARNSTSLIFNSTVVGKYSVDVFDVSGRRVERLAGVSGIGLNKIELDLKGLSGGVYTIIVTDKEHGRRNLRLVKE